MKRIIILLFMILPIIAYGENMCVKDGSIMVVLDPQISGTGLSSDATNNTWSTQFSYGIVSGISICSYACGQNTSSAPGVVPTSQDCLMNQTQKTYCFCKMLHPVESIWIGNGYPGNSCSSGCAQKCSNNLGSNLGLRTAIFGNLVE
ncbi:MAG: hypothetical protein J6Y07_03675 [Alphaproteobacteria bacterium]|nr:hypothetical protein [Alphaproteobacteria bacterium]